MLKLRMRSLQLSAQSPKIEIYDETSFGTDNYGTAGTGVFTTGELRQLVEQGEIYNSVVNLSVKATFDENGQSISHLATLFPNLRHLDFGHFGLLNFNEMARRLAEFRNLENLKITGYINQAPNDVVIPGLTQLDLFVRPILMAAGVFGEEFRSFLTRHNQLQVLKLRFGSYTEVPSAYKNEITGIVRFTIENLIRINLIDISGISVVNNEELEDLQSLISTHSRPEFKLKLNDSGVMKVIEKTSNDEIKVSNVDH